MARALRFLDNCAIVLIVISDDEDATMAQIAERSGVTEKTVRRCLDDIESAGIISRTPQGRGRHTSFHLNWDAPLEFPNRVSHRTVAHLIHALRNFPTSPLNGGHM